MQDLINAEDPPYTTMFQRFLRIEIAAEGVSSMVVDALSCCGGANVGREFPLSFV